MNERRPVGGPPLRRLLPAAWRCAIFNRLPVRFQARLWRRVAAEAERAHEEARG